MTLVEQFARREIAAFSGFPTREAGGILSTQSFRLTGHSGPVNEVKFSADGKFLVSCANELILWKIERDVSSLGALHPHKQAITSVDFSCDSARIATGSADQTVAVVDVETGKVLRRFRHHKEIVNSVSFLRPPHRDLIVSGGDDGVLVFHDIRQKEPVQTWKAPSPVVSVAVEGTTVAFGGVCGAVFTGSMGEGSFQERCRTQCQTTVFGVAVDPNERYTAALDDSAHLTIFDLGPCPVRDDRVIAEIQCGEPAQEVVPWRVCFSAGSRYLISGGADGKTRIWDTENIARPLLKTEIEGHEGSVSGVAVHPSGLIVASSSTDTTVIVSEVR